MNANLTNIAQAIILLLSVVGNFLIALPSPTMQLIAFSIWSVANIISIVFLWIKGLKILSIQNIVFLSFNIFGIMNRI